MTWSLPAKHVPMSQFHENFGVALAVRLSSTLLTHKEMFHLFFPLKAIRVAGRLTGYGVAVMAVYLR